MRRIAKQETRMTRRRLHIASVLCASMILVGAVWSISLLGATSGPRVVAARPQPASAYVTRGKQLVSQFFEMLRPGDHHAALEAFVTPWFQRQGGPHTPKSRLHRTPTRCDEVVACPFPYHPWSADNRGGFLGQGQRDRQWSPAQRCRVLPAACRLPIRRSSLAVVAYTSLQPAGLAVSIAARRRPLSQRRL